MQLLLTDIGINQKQFLVACQGAKNNKSHWKIVKQILLVDDFDEFKKIMIKRNADLEKKALSLMLQNEEKQLQDYMKSIGVTKKGVERGVDNSFSSEEESSEEEMDEGMRMAIELSKEQERVDKQKRELKGMMSDTDGFNQAMHMSMKEQKPTKGMDDMQAMMSDTAGFQKILEMSKREEEARL